MRKKKSAHIISTKPHLTEARGFQGRSVGLILAAWEVLSSCPEHHRGSRAGARHGRAVCVLGWSRRTPLLLLPHLGTNGRTGTRLAVPAGPWPYAQWEEDTPIQRIPRQVLVSFSENECLQLLTKGFYSLISVFFCFCFLSYIARQ